jgi:hypothetical protein
MKPVVIIAIAVVCSVIAVFGVLTIPTWYVVSNVVSNTNQQGEERTYQGLVPGGVGALGSEHSHAGILVKIFGDEFDFSAPAYQIKSPWIHFEAKDGTNIHKHATGVKLGWLFSSLSIGLDDQCFVFPDGRAFCTNDNYSLKFFINGESVSDIRNYEIIQNDKILITFGGETDKQIEDYFTQLDNQVIDQYQRID